MSESAANSISLVIPLFNEAESLPLLWAEIRSVLDGLPESAEVIFVDDGSMDASWEILARLALEDPRIRAVRLRRNFGKAAALVAGFRRATGDILFTLDADLQDDPAEIPRFLQRIHEGFDLVSGWKQSRRDPIDKTLPSKVFNWMVSTLTGVRLHDHNCGFKCYRRQVIEEIELYGEFHRFMAVLADARGFRISEIPVHHRPRRYGRSKYGWRRFARGFLDLITVKFLTSFTDRPQHLLGGFGLACLAIGSGGLGYAALLWCLGAGPIGTRPIVSYSATTLLFGTQMLSISLVAALIKANAHTRDRIYSVREEYPARGDKLSPEPPVPKSTPIP